MSKPPNIILLSADSLRADHLGCYGYSKPTSPQIDSLAVGGVLCEQAFVPVLPTQPSHTTIFTGQSPLTHGVVAHGGTAKLSREAPFLPEIFLEEDYATCSIDTLFRERIWFSRGYEYLIDPGVHHVYHGAVTQEELNDRAIKWIKTVPKGPFFMFIHYWDAHYPYDPPSRYREAFYPGGKPADPSNHTHNAWFKDHPLGSMARDTWLRSPDGPITDPAYVTGLYDGEICYLDEGIGNLTGALEQLGLAEDTIIVFLGDHGESMTEHGVFYDHYGLYDCTMRVPLILHWPGGGLQKGMRIPSFMQLSDVAPTLLEAADISIPEEMTGRSFLGHARGEEELTPRKQVLSMESTWQAKYCLRTETHKIIVAREKDLLGNPMRELYDLHADPLELNNLAEADVKLANAMEAELEACVRAGLAAAGKTADPVRAEGAAMAKRWLAASQLG